MKIYETHFHGLLRIESEVFTDTRGWFMETYNQDKLLQQGLGVSFVQDNISYSKRGVLRGLHFQRGRFAQGKLIRVLSGMIYDVAVDMRVKESTYRQAFEAVLSPTSQALYVPPGFAHGFTALEDDTQVLYKVTKPRVIAAEFGLRYNDPSLNIQWSTTVDETLISARDKNWPLLAQTV